MSKLTNFPEYKRPIFDTLWKRIHEPRRFLQIIAGPRQTGKTTLVKQILSQIGIPHHYATADAPTLQEPTWIEQQWDIGRIKAKDSEGLLILDEVQKVHQWSELVKRLWDEDSASATNLQIILLGSSPLLMQKGLSESLAGRFEVLHLGHWSFTEMKKAFDWRLDQYLYFGGYPGAAPLIDDEQRWRRYVNESLIETTISRDLFLVNRVDKPALLRRLFQLGCQYSSQILSYQKMVGQLQDAGNTTTLAHYLDLLTRAGMLTYLQKFSGQQVRTRGSSPKLQALNLALVTAQQTLSFEDAIQDRDFWGRQVESAVGAHLLNSTLGSDIKIYYWRDRNREVDFVLERGRALVAIEVKSGRKKTNLPGIKAFAEQFQPARKLLIGRQGIALEEFLDKPIECWF